MLSRLELEELHEFFQIKGWKWRVSGKEIYPSLEDLDKLLGDCVKVVRESEESISVESGRLLVKRTDGHIDVYFHVGEIND